MPTASQPIYLDHSATTAVDPRVIEAMLPYWQRLYGNPSSLYPLANEAQAALQAARTTVADILGARPAEIVFTSGGTESDNLALRGVTLASKQRGNHVITTPIEHHAVGHTCTQLAHEYGLQVTTVPVDAYGSVNPDDVGRAITDHTVLISVMYANNEIGTIEPIAEIGRLARAKGIPFHTDAVQAPGLLPLNVDDLQVDLLALSGHKFYAPKGIGVLYVRAGTPLLPTQTGGSQERGLRAGTENVAAIVGLARALQLAEEGRPAEVRRLAALRERLLQGVLQPHAPHSIPQARLTGHPQQRLAGHASLLFEGVDGEALVLRLGLMGIAASSGSACAASEEGPSHVLMALGIPYAAARGSLRLTLGRENTEQEIDHTLGTLSSVVASLRSLSPLYHPDALADPD